jgi:hypothetical protein
VDVDPAFRGVVAAGVVDQVGGQAFQQDRVPADRRGVQGVGDARGVGLDVCGRGGQGGAHGLGEVDGVVVFDAAFAVGEGPATRQIAAQGQIANGVEAAELLSGIAKPAWYGVLSWLDEARAAVWRADEVQFVSAAPVRSRGSLRDAPELPDAWWEALNTSLDNLARQRTTRLATPDTETIIQALVTAVIERAFPDQVDTTITGEAWVPAHADLNWANLTGPEFWILDWEDHGLAPRGLGAANLEDLVASMETLNYITHDLAKLVKSCADDVRAHSFHGHSPNSRAWPDTVKQAAADQTLSKPRGYLDKTPVHDSHQALAVLHGFLRDTRRTKGPN